MKRRNKKYFKLIAYRLLFQISNATTTDSSFNSVDISLFIFCSVLSLKVLFDQLFISVLQGQEENSNNETKNKCQCIER